jgi:uncharacterized protein (DUF433 family)
VARVPVFGTRVLGFPLIPPRFLIADYRWQLTVRHIWLYTLRDEVNRDAQRDHQGSGNTWGEPVFRGTRVPFKILIEYLEGGDTLDQFLEQYPSVSRELAIAAIEEARLSLVSQLK